MAVDTKLTKTPHKQEEYSQDQLIELAKCANDPKYFMTEHCYIQHPTKGRMKFDLFDYQRELVDTYHDNRYSIIMVSVY